MAPHGATKTSPYELVYGHHAVLPWEMQSDSRRVVLQKDLSAKDYSGLMMDELQIGTGESLICGPNLVTNPV
jgi:hypothetical protein